MLLDQRRDLTVQMEWVMTQRTKLQNASTELQKEFKALAETESK